MTGDFDEERWRSSLRRKREEKDRFFAEHARSPLPAADREDFDGLSYFPPDPACRYVLELHEHGEKTEIEVTTTTDGTRRYRQYGEFRFDVSGEEETLQAFEREAGEGEFWVPFRDETNGEETYPAGRYLDLEPGDHRTADGRWIVDFNDAYNPFCAYSDRYECPLVPLENWLDVRIEAGEKTYEGSETHRVD